MRRPTDKEHLAKTERWLEIDLCRVVIAATQELNFDVEMHRLTNNPKPLDIDRLTARAAYAKRLLFDLWRGEPVLDVLSQSINVPR